MVVGTALSIDPPGQSARVLEPKIVFTGSPGQRLDPNEAGGRRGNLPLKGAGIQGGDGPVGREAQSASQRKGKISKVPGPMLVSSSRCSGRLLIPVTSVLATL